MTTTANESLQRESQTESCETRPYSAISEHSSVKGTPTAIRDWLTSFLPASHVNRSASPASERETPTTETSGLKPSMSFAEYDQFTRTWRTYQVSLLTLTPDEFSETWPKAGMTVDGVGYLQPKQELRIAEIGYGLLPSPRANKWGQPDSHGKPMWMFPTPAATPYGTNQGGGMGRTGPVRHSLNTMARKGLWPTPTNSMMTMGDLEQARYSGTDPHRPSYAEVNRNWPTPHGFSKDGKSNGPSGNELGRAVNQFMTPTASRRDATPKQFKRGNPNLAAQVGGSLNPTWVEWLMGWPLGWTALEPLEMDKFQQWCEQHGIC